VVYKDNGVDIFLPYVEPHRTTWSQTPEQCMFPEIFGKNTYYLNTVVLETESGQLDLLKD
jgi:hypothetical protein